MESVPSSNAAALTQMVIADLVVQGSFTRPQSLGNLTTGSPAELEGRFEDLLLRLLDRLSVGQALLRYSFP